MTCRAILCAVFLAVAPALVLAQKSTPGPSVRGLLDLSPREFQAYVSGVYEGQAMLAAALKVPQIICVDPMMNRRELALIVRGGISRLPDRALRLPARVTVFRVLFEQVPCPGFRWEGKDGE